MTTEKDAVNLCEGADDLLAPLPLYWLKIEMRIEGEAELVAEMERRIGQETQFHARRQVAKKTRSFLCVLALSVTLLSLRQRRRFDCLP